MLTNSLIFYGVETIGTALSSSNNGLYISLILSITLCSMADLKAKIQMIETLPLRIYCALNCYLS
jgi:hypothetical protein